MLYQQLEELIKKYNLETKDSELVEQAIEILYKQKQRPTTKKAYSIRLNVDDMEKIKAEAKEQWLPYQTLIWSILHQYVEGSIK